MSFSLIRSIGIVGCIAALPSLQSCGGSKSKSANAPDYSLSASPTSLTVQIGGPGSQVSVSASAQNAFRGTVSVAVTGLPAGVTATPSSFSVRAGKFAKREGDCFIGRDGDLGKPYFYWNNWLV